MKYDPQSLIKFSKATLRSFGCNETEADIVADHLIEANLAGHDSHGVGMLPMYGAQVKDGNLIPNQMPEIMPAQGAVSVIDAKKGFGHRMALLALDAAIETIDQHRVAVMSLRNSGHISRVGTYSEYCAAKGYVSLHFVNVVGHDPIVAPFGASEGGFSTNPISMAMPVQGKAAPLLDIATSTVAFGKVRVANNKGETVPDGWIVDGDGVNTNDPSPMADHKIGALSAFGAYKGSGLGIFAELMAGALAGTSTVDKADIFPNGVLNNMLSIIIDPEAFDDRNAIEDRIGGFSSFIKSRKPAKDVAEVLLPGEPENQFRADRSQYGISVDDETIRQITETITLFGQEPTDIVQLLTTP